MNEPRRVVITGIGAVTPIGHGREGLWTGVCRGRSAVGPVTRFDATGFRSRVCAQIDSFDPLDYMAPRSARRMDRFAQLGLAAAQQAVSDGRLTLDETERQRTGVSLGSALGGIAFGEDQHARYLRGGLPAVSPMLAIAVYGGASASNIAIELGMRGPNGAHASSCASGAVAIGEALRLIQRDEADIMLAGGAEAPLAPLTFGAFSLIKAMSTHNDDPCRASRPFDTDRDGFVMAEGAAVLLLEEREHALRREAPIYAELVGYGQTNDAFHMTAPRPDGSEAARALSIALADARVAPTEVDYINAHATGTPLGDAAEACAIHRALGPHGSRVRVSGTKGLYGHALGASGAIEVALTALALTHAFLPGTTNLQSPDPCCGLALLPAEGSEQQAEIAISTSFGFGGANAALVLRHAQAE